MTQHLLDSDKYSELMEIGSTVAAYTLRDRTVYYIASQTKLKVSYLSLNLAAFQYSIYSNVSFLVII